MMRSFPAGARKRVVGLPETLISLRCIAPFALLEGSLEFGGPRIVVFIKGGLQPLHDPARRRIQTRRIHQCFAGVVTEWQQCTIAVEPVVLRKREFLRRFAAW